MFSINYYTLHPIIEEASININESICTTKLILTLTIERYFTLLYQ